MFFFFTKRKNEKIIKKVTEEKLLVKDIPKKKFNSKLCLKLVSMDGLNLQYFPPEFRAYQTDEGFAICEAAVTNNGLAIKYIYIDQGIKNYFNASRKTVEITGMRETLDIHKAVYYTLAVIAIQDNIESYKEVLKSPFDNIPDNLIVHFVEQVPSLFEELPKHQQSLVIDARLSLLEESINTE